MNTQTKLLNDALASTARMLDEVFSAEDVLTFIDINADEIEMALIEASEALASIKPEDSGGNTWAYDSGDPCEDDNCRFER